LNTISNYWTLDAETTGEQSDRERSGSRASVCRPVGVRYGYTSINVYCHDLQLLDEADTAAAPEQPVAADMEFENEEQLATVTVVEDFDAADLKTLSPERATFKENQSKGISGVAKGPPRPQQRPKNAKPTYTKPKFKYETKAARIHEKIKQRGRREERAKRKNGRR